MPKMLVYSQLIERELEQFSLPKQPGNLYDPLRYFLQLGGKRMRPILTLMGAKAFGKEPSEALAAAMAVELFHNFSLIHDDIMDEAPLRRKQATVHTKWNQSIAILSGDVLLVKAYQQVAQQETKHLADLLQLFNATAVEVCEGQQMDMDFESRENVTIAEYIEMIRLKTSVLLGCALEMGAIVADALQKDRELIYEFGQQIGIAFQIQDDLLDLYADPDKFGKQVGGDVLANKKTLLLLKAYELANHVQKKQLDLLLTESNPDKKVSSIRDLFNQLKVAESCQTIMEEHYSMAKNALSQTSLSSESKAPLLALASSLMEREI